MIGYITSESLNRDGKIGRLDVNVFNIKAIDYHPKYKSILRKFRKKIFIWDLHTDLQIEKYLKFSPDAIYSDFPDVALRIRDQN
jgi:hypothetical protein